MRLNKLVTAAVLAVNTLLLPVTQAADDPLKVGFVYVGPVGDHGWSYEHDQGRQELEQHFDGKVETTYVENVPEGADAERASAAPIAMGHPHHR